MWRGAGGVPDGLPLAEMGESNHHDHGRKDSACDNDLWPPDPDLPLLPPPPRPFVRMGSTMTGSEASLPGPRRKEQRRQEWLNSEILNAVLSGAEVEKVAQLMENGGEANAVCSPTRTSALHLCAIRVMLAPGAQAGAVAVASLLLKHGADIAHRDHCDRTALHLAAWAGASELLDLLLKSYQAHPRPGEPSLLGIRTRSPRDHGEREPFPASWNDSWNHAHSAVGDALPYLEPGSTALHIACQRVHLRCIRLLTSAGADRSVLDDRGFTPIDVLHEFPGSGEDEDGGAVVTEVKNEDAERDAPDDEAPPHAVEGRTVVVRPPDDAVHAVHPAHPVQDDIKSAVKKAAAGGVPLVRSAQPPQPPQPARIASADTRLLEAIGWLKKEGAGNFMTGSALHTAVTTGCLKVVETLLSVDPDSAYAPNAKGDTPVHAAIEARSIEALRLLMKANEKAINWPNSSTGTTPLMMAVVYEWNEGVSELLLANADVAACDHNGSTVLHDAAMHADSQLLRELLSIEEAMQVLDAERKEDGLTPLFVAVESKSTERVQLFIEAGAKMTHTLPDGVNIMHRAVQLYSLNVHEMDEEIVCLLADRLCRSVSLEERNLLDALQSGTMDPGLAPLHMAAKNGHANVMDVLLRYGSNPRVRTVRDGPLFAATALHLAAQYGHIDVVSLLIERDRKLMSTKDGREWRPIHMAAHYAQREVLRFMIKEGADLATGVRDEQNRSCSALSLLVHSVAKPVDFLEELLDESIALNEYPVSDHRAKIDVRYDILIPAEDGGGLPLTTRSESCPLTHRGEEHHVRQVRRQMRVIDAILESGNYFGQQNLLQHPLIESFLTLKWKKMAPFFYAIVAVHVLFVCALTGLVAQIYWWAGDQGAGVQVARVAVFVTTVIIALQEVLHLIQLRLMYIRDLESWLKWIAISLSVVVAFVVFEGVESAATAPTVSVPLSAKDSLDEALGGLEQLETAAGLGAAGAGPGPGAGPEVSYEVRGGGRLGDRWERHVTTLAVLMAYTELLLLLCRFPRWGLRVLMFYKVAINVIKMLLTFSFLIVGFALSFFVQFRGEEPFPTLLESMGKTIVMGTSEFDYGDIFTGSNDSIVGRMLFFIFLLLVPVVLMNLLVGLAVSDIATLETKGRKRGLVKQAEFLSTLERLVYSHSVRWCIPSRMRARLPIYIPVERAKTIYPGQSLRIIFEEFPENIRNGIVAIAIRNAAQRSSSSMDIMGNGQGSGPVSSPVHLPGCGGAATHAGWGAETKLYEELSLVRRDMATRRELHDANERTEKNFRAVHRELEALRARVEHILNSLPR
ncbi:uncharacterized protein LOC117652550 [Thrips palmi]|uniref:Uncharacterized protein LOC117652550 n=1 Tax=Thrips palmi TaxID=161013 RepID=A0A6P9A7E1_THRPL|nr:uncharacterized protein LOC117652550 [Thrips palmi]